MTESNCKDCKERHSGCHSECEKYKAFREKIDKTKKKNYAVADYFVAREKRIEKATVNKNKRRRIK